MKIRAKNIRDVIKFTVLEPGEDGDVYPNTNIAEVKFIIEELLKLKESKSKISVGIITPHTNQQKLLSEEINKMGEKFYFYDFFDLKIMTFDTCQGEERDLIFYSMVATREKDKLWAIFIKNLSNVDIEEDGQIKAQRLNVGFSRGKECIHFVLSKPVEEFSGSIGEALVHYSNQLEEASKERSISEVDSNSPMEQAVLNWFYQTNYWENNKENSELIPQFKIGEYLKQLDPLYTHPNYKVDFLLVHKTSKDSEQKIVIEYDGFNEHFKNSESVNEQNFEDYLNDDDVYRQKVLESYGYEFIRINRFNSGKNPIDVLDRRLKEITARRNDDKPWLNNVNRTIQSINAGEMKECPKCKTLREAEDFKDSKLETKYGRFCRFCKQKPRKSSRGNRRGWRRY
jgi:very-short-patch-repair endonuclease